MKIRAVLGGNLLLVSTGSAPISGKVIDFMRIALCCEVAEGTHSTLLSLTTPHFFAFQGESESFRLGMEG